MNSSRGTTVEETLDSYQPPAVEERAPISAPLRTVAQTIERKSPRWRRPEND